MKAMFYYICRKSSNFTRRISKEILKGFVVIQVAATNIPFKEVISSMKIRKSVLGA
jgi:hypothetical protein